MCVCKIVIQPQFSYIVSKYCSTILDCTCCKAKQSYYLISISHGTSGQEAKYRRPPNNMLWNEQVVFYVWLFQDISSWPLFVCNLIFYGFCLSFLFIYCLPEIWEFIHQSLNKISSLIFIEIKHKINNRFFFSSNFQYFIFCQWRWF